MDDEPANVRLLERTLSEFGYRDVRGITDSREVEGALEEFGPDLLLLDLSMPHVDGFGVMQLVAERVPKEEFLPVLVLTADATPSTKLRALSVGATDFLTKPIERVEVLLRIRNLLEARMLHQQQRAHNEMLNIAVQERTRDLQETIEDLRKADADRRLLVARLVEAQEDERERVAHDIHDDTIQAMTAVGLRVEALARRLDGAEDEAFAVLRGSVQGAIERLRHLLFELRPPVLDQEGLAAALRESLAYLEGRSDLDWSVENELHEEPPREVRTLLYRVAREAITNVRKHAEAQSVRISLGERDDGYHVRVVDDGRGLHPDGRDGTLPGQLGLPSIRERIELAGGWINIHSLPGAGTSVEFWLPRRAADVPANASS